LGVVEGADAVLAAAVIGGGLKVELLPAILLLAREYDLCKDAWRVTIPLKHGQVILLECGLDDLERLHAAVRAALVKVSMKRMEAEA